MECRVKKVQGDDEVGMSKAKGVAQLRGNQELFRVVGRGWPTTWSGHRGGMVSLETSAAEVKLGKHASLGLWEENPQGPEGNQAEPPSQELSSGYVEEMVAGIAQLKLGTPPHEIESPTAQVLRTRHLLAMPATSIPENLSGMDLAV